MKRRLSIFFFILIGHGINAAELIRSSDSTAQSFPFTVGPHGYYIPTASFFVGATENAPDNAFTLSKASIKVMEGKKAVDSFMFIPLAPAKAIVNNQPATPNPINGKAIDLLALMAYRPVVTIKDDTRRAYLVENRFSNAGLHVFQTPILNDANGNPTTGVVALAASRQYTFIEAASPEFPGAAFAAVTNPGGGVNGAGAGIALINFRSEQVEIPQAPPVAPDCEPQEKQFKRVFTFLPANAQTGEPALNKAAPLNPNAFEIQIGAGVPTIKAVNDLYYADQISDNEAYQNNDLQTLYIGLQASSGAAAQDGVRGVVAAGIVNNQLIYKSIVPATAIQSSDKIIATRGANEEVSIHKLRVMYTRTYLQYLIVVGDNGTIDTKKHVYALPLVYNPASPDHATLADVSAEPQSFYSAGTPEVFFYRAFTKAAQTPAELYSNTDVPARVGGNAVLPGDITDITVINDGIFVSVAQQGNNERPGIFYSQALFDAFGVIKGWTNWQRASGQYDPIIGFNLDPHIGVFWFLPTMDGTTKNVFRTQWSKGETANEKTIEIQFDPTCGGVQGLSDFPKNTPSLSNNIGERISFQALTGLKKVVLIQTGLDTDSGVFTPNNADYAQGSFTSTDGSLTGIQTTSTLNMISITGGILDELLSIRASEIVSDGQYGWLFVGGARGLAVLARPDGTSWSSAVGLEKSFKGLTADMAFKKIGEFNQIRKLQAFNNRLYILTVDHLYVMDISAAAIASNTFNLRIIAQTRAGAFRLTESFSDMVISEPLGLIATSSGLYRSANNKNIAIAQSDDFVSVNLPESAGSICAQGPVTRFFPISRTGFVSDLADEGYLWVLNAYVGLNQAQIYRLSIDAKNGVDNASVQLLPDQYIKDRISFFANLEDYRNFMATDGSMIFVTRSAFGTMRGLTPPVLLALNDQLKGGGQRRQARNPFVVELNINNFHSIGQPLYTSASGAWTVSGDFGIRFNN